MNTKIYWICVLWIGLALILAGCGGATETQAPPTPLSSTLASTATPAPTDTPIPPTVIPTYTPAATATSTLEPLPTSSLSDPEAASMHNECRQVVDGLITLKTGLGLPDHYLEENPSRQPGDFDPMGYFQVLDRLQMAPGNTLDYVYFSDELGGKPLVYARKVDAAPFTSYEELLRSLGEEPGDESSYDRLYHSLDYLEQIKLDESPESYFQLFALALSGDQFYLSWHAGYNDGQFVCDAQDLERITREVNTGEVGQPLEFPASLNSYDLAPAVKMVTEDTVALRYLAFTKWGGLYELHYLVNRENPLEIIDQRATPLFEYDCGIMF